MKGTLSLLFLLICIFNLSSCVSSGSNHLISGITCKGKKVVQENIVLDAQQNEVRKKDYSWYSRGKYSISCVKITNNNSLNAEDGQARIKKGGETHDYVEIELISKKSERLDLTVEIWAQEVVLESRAASS
ncbi:uncharacterized protein LOC143191626 [Rhynchophorus ferrugineus]|uniref:uncharacterized protein LOC143191626 n=1 Tax=Rhynchophorus ferrugineus TaxID=354439 RepID=UPI003FCDFCBF